MGKFSSKDYKNNCKNDELKNDDEKNELFLSPKKIGNGLIIFFLGSLLGLLVFAFTYKVLLSSYDISYLVKALIAAFMALLILFALQKSIGSKDEKMQAPILSIIAIAFLLTVLNGYEAKLANHRNDNQPCSSLRSEVLTFESTERLLTQKDFSVGTECRITARGSAVNLINGAETKELTPEHGTYIFEIMTKGPVIFKGSNAPSRVTIEWR